MAASTATAVVFDLGGVLIDWDPRYMYRSLFDGDDEAMEEFLSEITTQEWNGHQDAGRSWSEAIEVLAAQHPERRELIAAFWERWPEMLGGALDDTVAILAELRAAGVRVYALSNWSAETFPRARPRFPFLDWFDGIVISGEVRLVKPDPRIFRHLLETHGLEAERTVFVDDSETNIKAAAELGMIAIHFEGAGALRRELRTLGLPIANLAERDTG
ncbi:MAG: HAD family phosphatase [Chloroflexota bacterium]|nr:HAD family phosphatase [Chloroflexota bacterium]